MDALVKILDEKCTSCYACVRECPVKAIRLKASDDKPKILENRCIGCGSCITSCSFDAIMYRDSKKDVKKLLKSNGEIVAIVDPSISAEFSDITDYRKFVQMIRALGFKYVNEVSFGVDLIARKYFEFFGDFKGKYYITSNDPVVVSYIEKFHPELINNLTPLVSPMIATSKVVHEKYGAEIKVVYIGPNIACKDEALRYKDDGKVDVVLTFIELRELFDEFNISEETLEYGDFDHPIGYKGSLYPLPNGLVQAADISENILTSNVISIEGKQEMIEAIQEFEEDIRNIERHFNISFGNNLKGPGTSRGGKRLNRQALVIQYVNKRLLNFFRLEWDDNIRFYNKLNLSRGFRNEDQRLPVPDDNKIQEILKTIKVDEGVSDRGCKSCGYQSCRDFAVSVAQGLTTPEMCITFSRKNQQDYIKSLKTTNEKLAKTQEALKDSEKLAQKEKDLAREGSETITAMLQKLRAGVVIINKSLKVIHSNETFVHMLGDDARDINEVIPGLKGADLKSLLPYNFYNLFTYVLSEEKDIPNKDVMFNNKLLNVSVFNIKKNAIVGAVVRDLYQPTVQREEVISRVTEVIDKNLEMVQKIGFLLGEGATETEKMLNSIIESFKTDQQDKKQ